MTEEERHIYQLELTYNPNYRIREQERKDRKRGIFPPVYKHVVDPTSCYDKEELRLIDFLGWKGFCEWKRFQEAQKE